MPAAAASSGGGSLYGDKSGDVDGEVAECAIFRGTGFTNSEIKRAYPVLDLSGAKPLDSRVSCRYGKGRRGEE